LFDPIFLGPPLLYEALIVRVAAALWDAQALDGDEIDALAAQ
jgi:hypothetical protein